MDKTIVIAVAICGLLTAASCNKAATEGADASAGASQLAADSKSGVQVEHAAVAESHAAHKHAGSACSDPACKAGATCAVKGEGKSACSDANCKGCPSDGKTDKAVSATLAGTTLDVDGRKVEVFSVGNFDKDYKKLSGLIAVEGRVNTCQADKGAFVMIDCANLAGCKESCCPQAEVPVRLDMSTFEGSLPATGQTVVVIGDITATETGYSLKVQQVRSGETVLLKQAGLPIVKPAA